MRWLACVIVFVVSSALGFWWLHTIRQPSGSPSSVAAPVEPATYVDPARCVECHETEAAAWRGSHHDLAMQEASPATVLGDFADAELRHHGVVTRFFRDGERYRVNAEDATGAPRDFDVRYAFGVTPLQQYLLEGERGRLQALSICFDPANDRWFSLYDERIPPGDSLHWTGPQFTWNYMCADCHSTGLVKGYDADADVYHTTYADIDVGCQACHGPGSRHVAWASSPVSSRESAADLGFDLHLKGAPAPREVDACGRCHSRREPIDERSLRDGESFLDHHVPELLRDPLYFADGQIREEVYVYGSFLQSRMHARGVRCTDCHDPHTARLKADGDALCVRCHQPNPPEPFLMPSPKRYDTPEHHHHPDGPGSACVDCHMPARTYMVVDPRRDHRFAVPRPDLSERLGTPNACVGCHADRDDAWAATAVERWFPDSERRRQPHYGSAFAAARTLDPGAPAILAAILDDAQAAGIVRATATEALGAYGDPDDLRRIALRLEDRDPLVRRAAVTALADLIPVAAPVRPQQTKAALMEPMLADPVKGVRIEAARVASELPPELRPAAFGDALAEYQAQLALLADRPEGNLNRAVLLENLGDPSGAEAAYRRALRLDPTFSPARFNLAQLLARRGRRGEAEAELRAVLTSDVASGEAHFSLGLLLAESDRLEDAVEHLGQASRLLPQRARVAYNHGLALQHLGRRGEAELALLRAYSLDELDPEIVHALAIFYMQEERWGEALPYAMQLVELTPQSPQARELLGRVERATR